MSLNASAAEVPGDLHSGTESVETKGPLATDLHACAWKRPRARLPGPEQPAPHHVAGPQRPLFRRDRSGGNKPYSIVKNLPALGA